ncbi:MAG: porin family protein [Alistipes senegalensis]|nr:porin family protein [Bacteroides cellulosilyticus]MCM1351374.1 porin family protein [Alistipes senegalensis]
MKKLFISALVALFAFGGASAQERGDWAVGPRIGIYTHTGADGAIFGIGAVGRYSFTNHWRIEPAITALCKSGCSVDINADMHYQFRVARVWSVYPAVGLSANDIGGWSLGVNIGAGTDFTITRRWDVSAGFKWMLQTAEHHKNPMVITIGTTYKF